MTLSTKDLYAYSDAEIGNFLAGHGFVIDGPGTYERRGTDGTDRIVIDPLKGQTFQVLLSYFPQYLDVLRTLAPKEETQGFPVGPYLSPHTVSSRSRSWSFKTAAAMERSIGEVRVALGVVGIPWLARLREPNFYLSQVTPYAEIVRALSAERAGELDIARAALEEMYRRYKMIHEQSPHRMPEHMAKGFIFVAEKLDRDPELRRELASRLKS